MNLPTKEISLQYFDDYVVPRNIYKHCLAVREVANFLAKELSEAGIEMNLELIDRVALLHDLFKVVTFENLEPNKYHKYLLSDNDVTDLIYPQLESLDKIKSINIEKTPNVNGTLTGIKGQYLIIDNLYVLNVRKYTGYSFQIEII